MQSPSIDNDPDEELFVKSEPVESNPNMDIPDSIKVSSPPATNNLYQQCNSIQDNTNTTPQKRQPNKSECQPDDDDPPIKKRKRSGTLSPYPATYESDSEDDNKKLLRMEEVEGKSWTEIQKAVREITGKQFSGSRLVAQYLRMKEDMVLLEVEKSDVCLSTPCSPELAIRCLTWWSGHGLILLMLGRSRF